MPLCLSSARGAILQPIAPPPVRNSQGFEYYPGRRLPVVCRDGVTRSAVCTGYASQGVPAAVQVYVAGKRRTVSGTIYPLPFSRLLSFYATGRNSDLIPLTSHKPRLAKLARKLIYADLYVNKGLPSNLSDLANDCRTELVGNTCPSETGWLVRRLFRRLDCETLSQLAQLLDRAARLQTIPPPPPPVE